MKNEGINITYEEALDILLQIPENKFITHMYEALKGECCSLGHLCKVLFNNPIPRSNINNINDVILYKDKVMITESSPAQCMISQISDGRAMDYFHFKYNQKTPKQRILSYLLDVVKIGKGDIILFKYD